ncbi:hypothetical protein [uncultured Roseobacter sp.]|uniref:hypothetical protein n=1 Tax=uncultured Roseobacter sp. TaxID=114847 RepID=UPI00262842CA|nr:hypothetical protein [uncultured Roseobacter sp.]
MVDIEAKSEALSSALERRLGVKGRSLAQQVKRAGRRLPRRIRAQAQLVAEADAVRGNPRLLRQMGDEQVAQAYSEVLEHLAGIDRADARRGRILSVLAAIAFNLILLFTALVVIGRLRGAI